MAYDPTVLSPIAVTDAAWALNTLRFILRDTTAPERYSDSELSAALELRAFTTDNSEGVETTYYRPQAVAASLIRSDPDRAITESIDNASETRNTPGTVAAGIEREWVRIDELIEIECGCRIPVSRPQIVF